MKIDNVFPQDTRKEIVIVRKDGVIKHDTRDVLPPQELVRPLKSTLFPISKERK